MAIAVSLRTAHFDVKDAERDSVRPVCAGKRSLGGYARELRPDVVAETPVTLPWGFTIAVPSEMV